MNVLTVTANLDLDPWGDDPAIVAAAERQHGEPSVLERLGVLPNSTERGRATVQVAMRMADGSIVIAQTTLRNFLMAAAVIAACPVAQMEDL